MVGGGPYGPTNATRKALLMMKTAHGAVADQDGRGKAARIGDSPSPSIGIAAAKLLDVEPETEMEGIA